MTLRPYHPQDCEEILKLFYETVRHISPQAYTPEQLAAWAPENPNFHCWQTSLSAHWTIVAEIQGQLAGFADLDLQAAYFDRLYVRWDCQKQGIGSCLAEAIEAEARRQGISTLTVHASIPARPFFERRGWKLIREQQVERNGISLTNFVMNLGTFEIGSLQV